MFNRSFILNHGIFLNPNWTRHPDILRVLQIFLLDVVRASFCRELDLQKYLLTFLHFSSLIIVCCIAVPQRSATSQCIAITKRNMAKILSTLLLPLHSMLGLCSLHALLYALLCFMFCLLHGYLVLGNWAAYQGKAFPNIGCNWKGYPCNHVISTSCNRPPPHPAKKEE